MANIGDLVTTLIADASPYEKGTNRAIASNNVLAGSLDNIVGKLARQRKAFEDEGRTTRDNILASAVGRNGKPGATEGQINAALQELETVEAMRKKQQAQQRAIEADRQAKEAGESLITTLERQRDTVGMTSAELQLYRAKQAGASAADIERARALQQEIVQLQAAAEANESLSQEANRTAAAQQGMGRGSLLLTEGVRGLEDAVAGFTNNGLKGMLMATTNNMTQIGALAGGTAGMAVSVGAVAALIGVSLIPKMIEWANDTKKITEEKERLDKASKTAFDNEVERMEKLTEVAQRYYSEQAAFARQSRKGFGSSESIADQIEALKSTRSEDSGRQLDLETQQEMMRKQTPGIAKAVQEFELRPDRTWAGYLDSFVNTDASGRNNEETDAERKTRRESLDKLNNQRVEYQKLQAQVDAFNDLNAQRSKQLEELKKKQALEVAAERWNDERELNEQESQKELAAQERYYQRNLQNRQELGEQLRQIMTKESSRMGDELAKQEDKRQRMNLANRALNEGLISKDEHDKYSTLVNKPEEFGLGGSAAAIESNSKESYSAIVRAMNQTNKDDYTKKQYDEMKTYLPLLEKIEQKEVISVVVKS